MGVPRTIGLVGVLVLLAGAGAYALRGMLKANRGPEEVMAGLEDTTKGEVAKPMGADDVFAAPKPAPLPVAGRPVEPAKPAPDPDPVPAQGAPADPHLAARMAQIRAALRSLPVDKVAGADPTKVMAMITALEPVIEKDLAAHLAREAQRAKGPLDPAAESLYSRSAGLYNELPKLASLVTVGSASVRATERRGRGEGVSCTALPEGKIQKYVISAPSLQWTLTLGLDPAAPRNGERPPPFQGSGEESVTPRRGRGRRGGG